MASTNVLAPSCQRLAHRCPIATWYDLRTHCRRTSQDEISRTVLLCARYTERVREQCHSSRLFHTVACHTHVLRTTKRDENRLGGFPDSYRLHPRWYGARSSVRTTYGLTHSQRRRAPITANRSGFYWGEFHRKVYSHDLTDLARTRPVVDTELIRSWETLLDQSRAQT